MIEKIEGIELMRALEIGLRMKTIFLKGRSFSVDVKGFIKAKKFMKKDLYLDCIKIHLMSRIKEKSSQILITQKKLS